MDKIWQTISGLFFAAVLTVTMAGKAKAESNDEPALPEPAPVEIVEPAAQTSAAAQQTSDPAPSAESQEMAPETEETEPAAHTEAPAAAASETVPAENVSSGTDQPAADAPEAEQPAPAAQEETGKAFQDTAPGKEEAVLNEQSDAPLAEENTPIEEETVSAQGEAVPTETGIAAEEADDASEKEEPVLPGGESAMTVSSSGDETASEQEQAASEEEEAPADEEAEPAGENAAEEEKAVSAGEENVSQEEETAPQEEADPQEEETDPSAPGNEEETFEAEETEKTVTGNAAPSAVFLRSAMPGLRSAPMKAAGSAEDTEQQTRAGTEDESEGTEQGDGAEETEPNERILAGEIGPQEITSLTDITIKTAGFQQISTLTSDGDVYIIGTGILLVDNVDLLQGCGVYLQSYEKIYGEDGGTAALFVLTDEQDDMKTYTLINGESSDGSSLIPAVLDEEYVVPEGITLVVPEGTSLVMQNVLELVETRGDETHVSYSLNGYPEPTLEGEDVQVRPTSTSGRLTISQGAGMVIESGADFRCEVAEFDNTQYSSFWLPPNYPELTVQGSLTMDADINGGIIEIGETGNVMGSGYFTDTALITVQGDGTVAIGSLNVASVEKYARVYIRDGERDIGALNTKGSVALRYEDPITVGSIHVDGGTLDIANARQIDADTMTINDKISGDNDGRLLIKSGVIVLPDAGACTIPVIDEYDEVSILDGTTTTWHYLGHASTGGGTLRYSDSDGALQSMPLIPLYRIGEEEMDGVLPAVTEDENGNLVIPYAEGLYLNFFEAYDNSTYSEYTGITRIDDEEGKPLSYVCEPDSEISYGILADALGTEFTIEEDKYGYECAFFVETYTDGAYGYQILLANRGGTVDPADVVAIFRMMYSAAQNNTGGSVSTNTNTSYTGSGVLGGSGAGSVTGGTRRLAITGDRTPDEPEPDPDPDPEPEPDPTPEKRSGDIRVWTEKTQEEGLFELHIEIRGKEVDRTASPVKVRMSFTPAPGAETKPLYAVFKNADGTLTAFEATYDPVTGIITFHADMAGEFIIVAFDYEGEPFTDAFYQALTELPEIKKL